VEAGLKMAKAYDRRNIKALLAELKLTLEATPAEANTLEVLKLQSDLIALLVGQLGSLQMQVELLSRADEGPK